MSDFDTGGERFQAEHSGRFRRKFGEYVALHQVDSDKERRITSEEAEMVFKMVEQIEQQMGEHLRVWESRKYPGVRFVNTQISVLEMISQLSGGELKQKAALARTQTEQGDLKKEEWVLFSSISDIFFPTDGSIQTASDFAEDYVLRGVAKVVRSLDTDSPEDFVLTAISSPLTIGGRITQEHMDSIGNNNVFWTDAKLFAEYVAEKLESNPNTNYVLTGHSFGASMAEITARQLELDGGSADLNRVKVLADAPVVAHGGDKKAKRQGIKMALGAAKSAREAFRERRDDIRSKLNVVPGYKRALKKQGIDLTENLDQWRLKKLAVFAAMGQYIKGPRRTEDEKIAPEKIRVYVRQGIGDHTLTQGIELGHDGKDDKKNFLHVEEVERTLKFFVKGGHVMDKFRPENLKRFVNSARILIASHHN